MSFVLLLSLIGCGPSEPSDDLPSLDELQPPPPALLPPPCAPGSSFEVNQQPTATLAEAAELAGPGDTIVACAGDHTIGPVHLLTRNLTLRGETGDPADVTLRGGFISYRPPYTAAPDVLSFEIYAVSFVDDASLGVGTVGTFIGGDLVFQGAEAGATIEPARGMFYRTRFTGMRSSAPPLAVYTGYREPVIALDDVVFADHVTPEVIGFTVLETTARSGRLMMRDVVFEGNVGTAYGPMVHLREDSSLQMVRVSLRDNDYPGSLIQAFDVQDNTWIRGLSASDNVVGYPLISLIGAPRDIWITDSSFLRNDLPGTLLPVGSALGPEGPTLHLRDVDFGVGADTNTPLDIGGCPTDFGVVSGVIRYPRFCPR